MVEHVIRRPDRTFTFQVFAGYACLQVWDGPVVLCQGGHLGTGSALRPVPSLKEVAEKWLAQYETRRNNNVKCRKKK